MTFYDYDERKRTRRNYERTLQYERGRQSVLAVDREDSNTYIDDACREHLSEQLRGHYTGGRITKDDLDRRLERLWQRPLVKGAIGSIMDNVPYGFDTKECEISLAGRLNEQTKMRLRAESRAKTFYWCWLTSSLIYTAIFLLIVFL